MTFSYMKLEISSIDFSKNDIKNEIKLPKTLNKDLAHFLGIHLGDGHLQKGKYNYRAYYNGHWINEYEWYNDYLSKLILKLFNKEVYPSKGHNSVQMVICSKAIHSYLNKVCNLPIGSKKDCDIPDIIKHASPQIKKSFLRGMADTDFSLVFKNRHKKINYYPVIDYGTPNKTLRDSIVTILEELGFQVHCGDRIQVRKGKRHSNSYFQINGTKALEKWMKEIGFTNFNQLTKYWVWQRQGHLPPKTNVNDRIKILKKK